MAETVYFTNVTKRRNSTLQGTFSTSFDVLLKAPTSLDRPTFHIAAASFDYNAAKWGDRYYFIDDIVSVGNGRWEVSCVLDVLATYKTDILASTQFVSYSSSKTSIWLPDTRIPVLERVVDSRNSAGVAVLDDNGFYVLTTVGKDSCDVWGITRSGLTAILNEVNTWYDDSLTEIFAGDPNNPYDWSTVESSLESLSQLMTRTGFIGNAYADAPNCIRSCIWVPFSMGYFTTGASQFVWLGQFNTQVQANKIKTTPMLDIVSLSIPWHYSDWRRGRYEDLYLYLPFAGNVALSTSDLVNASGIEVFYSATASDGTIAYEVVADDQIIGTFGGQCSANVPIGISQQASAGAIAQTAFAGVEKTVSAAVQSTLSPISMGSTVAATALNGVETMYNIADVSQTRHNTCIGGIGGGAGSGLDLNCILVSVAHETAIDPDSIQQTMGLPTMRQMSLATLTGFCQCANAHVAAPAQAQELDAIDRYLNGGFYIE